MTKPNSSSSGTQAPDPADSTLTQPSSRAMIELPPKDSTACVSGSWISRFNILIGRIA